MPNISNSDAKFGRSMDYSDLLQLRRKSLLIQAATQRNPTNSPDIKPHFNQDKFTREAETNGSVDFYGTKSVPLTYSTVISGRGGGGFSGEPVVPPVAFTSASTSFVVYTQYPLNLGIPTTYPSYNIGIFSTPVIKPAGDFVIRYLQNARVNQQTPSEFPCNFIVPVLGMGVMSTVFYAVVARINNASGSVDYSPFTEITIGPPTADILFVGPDTSTYTITNDRADLSLFSATTLSKISTPESNQIVRLYLYAITGDLIGTFTNSSGQWKITGLTPNTRYYAFGELVTEISANITKTTAIPQFFFKTDA